MDHSVVQEAPPRPSPLISRRQNSAWRRTPQGGAPTAQPTADVKHGLAHSHSKTAIAISHTCTCEVTVRERGGPVSGNGRRIDVVHKTNGNNNKLPPREWWFLQRLSSTASGLPSRVTHPTNSATRPEPSPALINLFSELPNWETYLLVVPRPGEHSNDQGKERGRARSMNDDGVVLGMFRGEPTGSACDRRGSLPTPDACYRMRARAT